MRALHLGSTVSFATVIKEVCNVIGTANGIPQRIFLQQRIVGAEASVVTNRENVLLDFKAGSKHLKCNRIFICG